MLRKKGEKMFENARYAGRATTKVKSFGTTTDGSSMCSELQEYILKKEKEKKVPIGAIKKQA